MPCCDHKLTLSVPTLPIRIRSIVGPPNIVFVRSILYRGHERTVMSLVDRKGMVFSSRDGWVPRPTVVNTSDGGAVLPRTVPAKTPTKAPKGTRSKKRERTPFSTLKMRAQGEMIPVRYTSTASQDYSISGLGAYRSYARWPGKFFPNLGLTCPLDKDKPVAAPATTSHSTL